jgi:hypothetical protein
MNFRWISWILIPLSAVTVGCAALVLGTGAGAGAYSYVQGELIRTYPAGYADTMTACTQILEDLGMPVTQRRSDGEQTIISAERKDGTPVTIKVKIVDFDVTEVSVRTGVVGLWDRAASASFHEFIAKRLKVSAGAGGAHG